MDSDPRVEAAAEQLVRRFQFSQPNAETLARAVLDAVDSVASGERPVQPASRN